MIMTSNFSPRVSSNEVTTTPLPWPGRTLYRTPETALLSRSTKYESGSTAETPRSRERISRNSSRNETNFSYALASFSIWSVPAISGESFRSVRERLDRGNAPLEGKDFQKLIQKRDELFIRPRVLFDLVGPGDFGRKLQDAFRSEEHTSE